MKLVLPRLTAMALLLHISLPAAPCAAATLESPDRSPELAAGLAVAAPIGLMALTRLTPDPIFGMGLPLLGLGLGHFYLGDPVRGAVVTVGSTVAGVGAFNMVRALDPGGSLHAAMLVGAAVAVGLAATDAYATAAQASPSP